MTVEVAETALVELLALLDAEAWEEVVERLDDEVQLADELTASWLRGRDAVTAYLRAQAGIVTEIVSTPSSVRATLLAPEHALVTFNLRQSYRLDGEERRQHLTGTVMLRLAADRPKLTLFHLGSSDFDSADAGGASEAAALEPESGDTGEWSLGDEVRRRRDAAGYSLRAFAERTGLSASFLSQVERSQADPSVGSLRRIAQGLGVSIATLLGVDRRPHPGHRVGHRDDRTRIFLGEAGMTVEAFPALPDSRLEAYIAELGPGATRVEGDRSHPGEQFLYVLEGGLELLFDDSTSLLGPDDGVHVRTDVPHRIHPRAGRPLRYLAVQSRRPPG